MCCCFADCVEIAVLSEKRRGMVRSRRMRSGVVRGVDWCGVGTQSGTSLRPCLLRCRRKNAFEMWYFVLGLGLEVCLDELAKLMRKRKQQEEVKWRTFASNIEGLIGRRVRGAVQGRHKPRSVVFVAERYARATLGFRLEEDCCKFKMW